MSATWLISRAQLTCIYYLRALQDIIRLVQTIKFYKNDCTYEAGPSSLVCSNDAGLSMGERHDHASETQSSRHALPLLIVGGTDDNDRNIFNTVPINGLSGIILEISVLNADINCLHLAATVACDAETTSSPQGECELQTRCICCQGLSVACFRQTNGLLH